MIDKFLSLVGALVFLGLTVAGVITALVLPLELIALSVLLLMLSFSIGVMFLTMLENLKMYDLFDRRDAITLWNTKYSLN